MTAVLKDKKALAWMPAVLLLAVSIMTAAGISIIQPATAATASDTVVINGTVDPSVSVSDCVGPLVFTGNFTGAAQVTTASCNISMTTNAVNGAELDVFDNDATAPFFCRTGGTCTTDNDNFGNLADAAAPIALADDAFAATVKGLSGTALTSAAYWNDALGDGILDDTTPLAADVVWHPILAAAGANTDACKITTGTGACDVTFAGDSAADNVSGAYTGTVEFLATTL